MLSAASVAEFEDDDDDKDVRARLGAFGVTPLATAGSSVEFCDSEAAASDAGGSSAAADLAVRDGRLAVRGGSKGVAGRFRSEYREFDCVLD